MNKSSFCQARVTFIRNTRSKPYITGNRSNQDTWKFHLSGPNFYLPYCKSSVSIALLNKQITHYILVYLHSSELFPFSSLTLLDLKLNLSKFDISKTYL